jgi:hypothetical protein
MRFPEKERTTVHILFKTLLLSRLSFIRGQSSGWPMCRAAECERIANSGGVSDQVQILRIAIY